MSEVNLAAMADADKNRIEAKAPTPMQEINVALKECKFGFFHIRLLFTALVGLIANVLVTNASAYLLPRAECDLNMNLVQKGLLNATPYFGMLCSSILAGFLTDAFGRKKFLLAGYGGIFLCTLASGSSQTYEALVTSKFFEGIFFAIAFSPTVTLTSEFLHNGIRDRVMLCQSSFASAAQIVIALMSWGVLTQDWRYSFWDGYFVLNTWNIYLYICSLWSLAATILYAFLPESPKFLLSQKKYDEAREILIRVYKENTRKPAETYPCGYLWKGKAKQYLDETPEIEIKSGFKHQILTGLYNAKPMFQKPLVMYLTLICCMVFLNMALYNVLRLWYPQLSTIIEHSSLGDASTNSTEDLCQMLDKYTLELNQRKVVNTSDEKEVCVPKVSGSETYINSIIMGIVCLVPYLISSILVNKVGKKLLLFVAAITTCAGTLGLRFSNSKAAVVALFSMDTALTQTLISLLQTVIVEYFPTSGRTLAISIMMMCGRIGTLVGNVGFPILLNMGCVIPFYCMTGIMALVTVMTLFVPTKKK